MRKLFAFLFIALSVKVYSSNRLLEYYSGDIDLSEEEILELIDFTISESNSNHLIAYSYYLKAIRDQNGANNFTAFKNFDKAIEYLEKSDTKDDFALCNLE